MAINWVTRFVGFILDRIRPRTVAILPKWCRRYTLAACDSARVAARSETAATASGRYGLHRPQPTLRQPAETSVWRQPAFH
jgi:hypothetical protein